MALKAKPGNLAPVGKDLWRVLLGRMLKDKIVATAAVILLVLYGSIALAGFMAPYGKHWNDRQLANAPPTPIYLFTEAGELTWPYVFKLERQFNPQTFEYQFIPVEGERYPIQFFKPGSAYTLLGLIPTNVHLFGVESPGRILLLGTDMNGRDNFSRLFYGGQISLTIGFLSLLITIPIGLLYGGISGYFGGWLDTMMMRFAEIIMSIPTLYMLITLAAIIPSNYSSTQRFAMVVAILAFVGWAGFSRVIRGMVLALKEQEFVEAGRAIGLSSLSIITRHILPQTASYVIIGLTLAVPGAILAESGLSFLGLGIQQPDASWGNLLKEAQEISNILYSPWMLAPAVLIFIAILAFNVVGDAVRDVLDPKSQVRR